MSIAELEKQIKRTEDRHKAIPSEMEKLTAKLNGLRARRIELMASVGLGEPGAIEEVEMLEREIRELLREQARLNEINVSLNCSVQAMDAELFGFICEEELKELPKLKAALNAAMKLVGEALSKVDFSSLTKCSRHFSAPLSLAQQIEAELRREIGKALSAAVVSLIADPQRVPIVDIGAIEKILRTGLELSELRQEQVANETGNARNNLALNRRRLEEQTAF